MPRFVSKQVFMEPSKEILYSSWLLIDQPRIDQFAAATNDFQFIHTDPVKAAATPLGTTIAHGFLTLSLISHLTEELFILPPLVKMVYNYGLDNVRFLTPVKVNSQVRAAVQVCSVTEKRCAEYRVQSKITIEIDGEQKPALVAESLAMVFTHEGENDDSL